MSAARAEQRPLRSTRDAPLDSQPLRFPARVPSSRMRRLGSVWDMAPPTVLPPVRGTADGQLPAYLSNGVIGLRVRDVPLRRGVAIVNGLDGEDQITNVISAAEAPYPLAVDLQLGRTWLSDAPHRVDRLEQALDLATGELTSGSRFTTDAGVASVEVMTYCSRSEPTIVAQE